MKRTVTKLLLMSFMVFCSQSIYAQKWLKSIGKGLDKVNDALEQVDNALSGKNSAKKQKKSKKSSESRTQTQTQSQTTTSQTQQSAQLQQPQMVLPNITLNGSALGGYPSGPWQNNFEKGIGYEIYIDRFSDDINEEVINGAMLVGTKKVGWGCGTLTISDQNGDKTYYDGILTYAGRIYNKDNGLGTNYFCFKSVSKSSHQASLIAMKKDGVPDGSEVKGKVVVLQGELKNYPVLNDSCQLVSIGNGNVDPTPRAVNEKDLLEWLNIGLESESEMKGFGNVRQFINAHKNLEEGKPYYAVSKSGNAVNIRSGASTKAEKIGELPSGTSLYVLDETDGWCLVQLEKGKYGFVSLSVVNLTNTPLATTTVDLAAQNAFPVDKIVNWSKGWGNGKITPKQLVAKMKSLGYSYRGHENVASGMESFEDYTFYKNCTIGSDGNFGKVSGSKASIIYIGNDMAVPAVITFIVNNQQDYNTILNHAKTHMQSADDYSSEKVNNGWQVVMTYHDGYFGTN